MINLHTLELQANEVHEAIIQFSNYLVDQGKEPLCIAVAMQCVSTALFYKECGKDLNETKELIKIIADRIEQEVENG